MKVCALCHVAVVLGRIPFDRLEQVAEELLCEILERFEYALLREPDLAEKKYAGPTLPQVWPSSHEEEARRRRLASSAQHHQGGGPTSSLGPVRMGKGQKAVCSE